MSEFVRKSAIILTALLLVVATGGYSVYRHYCDCKDMMTTSVFLEMDCEQDVSMEAVPSCCSLEDQKKACCETDNNSDEDHRCHSGDCCQTNIEFIKIDDSYTSVQDKTSLKIFFIAIELFENANLFTEEFAEPAGNFYSDSSPPVTGRKLLLEHHQLKLSPPDLA